MKKENIEADVFTKPQKKEAADFSFNTVFP